MKKPKTETCPVTLTAAQWKDIYTAMWLGRDENGQWLVTSRRANALVDLIGNNGKAAATRGVAPARALRGD